MSKYAMFDRSRLKLLPLAQRQHDLDISVVSELVKAEPRHEIAEVGRRILKARDERRSVILLLGAHVLRAGMQRYLIDMMERGLISCIALNGAGVIHDFEFSLIGATTESVARYIKDGQFGLWSETGMLNDIIKKAAEGDLGLGEAVGEEILNGSYPHKDVSVLAAGARLGVPITVHVGIGYDIIHEHPNCDGAALGKASYTDFLIFAHVLENIDRGVIASFGSAVMAPEVFLKALSMVRNTRGQRGEDADSFTTMVCDLRRMPEGFSSEAPKTHPDYYFRPWKTMLVRTTGDSHYVCAPHAQTVPELWSATLPYKEVDDEQ